MRSPFSLRFPVEAWLTAFGLFILALAFVVPTSSLGPQTPDLPSAPSAAAHTLPTAPLTNFSALDTWSLPGETVAPISAGQISVPAGSLLTIVGWAVDPVARHAPKAVYGHIGSGPINRGRLGISRPDVAGVLGIPGAIDSGFSLDVRAPSKPGNWVLDIWLIAGSGRRIAFNSRPTITVTQNSASAQRP